ncbi:hypothetical protein [Crossiella sp. CA198]
MAYVRGAEGQRLRGELAAVIAVLLRWAGQQQSLPEQRGLEEDDRAA